MPSASTNGNIDGNPDSGHPPEALAADGTGVPSLHRPATSCPPSYAIHSQFLEFICIQLVDFNKFSNFTDIFFGKSLIMLKKLLIFAPENYHFLFHF